MSAVVLIADIDSKSYGQAGFKLKFNKSTNSKPKNNKNNAYYTTSQNEYDSAEVLRLSRNSKLAPISKSKNDANEMKKRNHTKTTKFENFTIRSRSNKQRTNNFANTQKSAVPKTINNMKTISKAQSKILMSPHTNNIKIQKNFHLLSSSGTIEFLKSQNLKNKENSKRSISNPKNEGTTNQNLSTHKINKLKAMEIDSQSKAYQTVELKGPSKESKSKNKPEQVNHFKIMNKTKDNSNILDILIELKNKSGIKKRFK